MGAPAGRWGSNAVGMSLWGQQGPDSPVPLTMEEKITFPPVAVPCRAVGGLWASRDVTAQPQSDWC